MKPRFVSQPAAVEGSNATERKPYQAPRLERLGNLRELTLGCTGGSLEQGRRRAGQSPAC